MSFDAFENNILSILSQQLHELEKRFRADCIFYYGPMDPALEKSYRNLIERLKSDSQSERLVIILNTGGGSAETVEKLVNINRFHYQEVEFVVPDFAMSAGTMLCMSGDRIHMDYSSSLGPIDPQVHNGQRYVPALGYLDKVSEFIEKAQSNTLTDAEFLIWRSIDLAELHSYEQARNLTVQLIKEWLSRYKFKSWTHHDKDTARPVSQQEKENRAEDIAKKLGDAKIWYSHSRFIGIEKLNSILRLQIDDYSNDLDLRNAIRSYNDTITGYIARNGLGYFFHSRNLFRQD